MALAFCGRKLFRPSVYRNSVRSTSYVVLVPEIGEVPGTDQFQQDQLEFNDLTIEKCVAAIANQSITFENEIREIEKNSGDFKSILTKLEDVGTPLDTIWGVAKTLYLGNSTTMPTKSYLQIHQRARRARSTKFNSEVIFNLSKVKENLTEEQTRVANKFYVEGKLNGLELSPNDKLKFYEIIKKLNIERKDYKAKLQMASKQFKQSIEDYNLVRDMPGLDRNSGPWTITLKDYDNFVSYCPSRNYRYNIWNAKVTRGATTGDKSLQISAHLEEIRYLRQQMAQMLNYKTFMEMSLETKMVNDLNQLDQVLETIYEAAKPKQIREFEELSKFAGEEIKIWDLNFWKRKQKESLYGNENLEFKLDEVLKKLFEFTQKLFNITIVEHCNKVSTWDPSVKYFDVFEDGKLIANFYLDPFTNNTDIHMISIRNKSSITKPIAALICNFPITSKLSLKDINSFLFKFGHLLQHCTTNANYSEVAGLSNIEWDAVDITGYLFTHFAHDIFQIPKLQHFQGHNTMWQLYKTKLDLAVHTNTNFWLDIQKELYPKYNLMKLEKNDSHLLQFYELFGENENGGGAYFSRIWSQMIAADIYSAFQEASDKDAIGKRFRSTFLAKGGASHPSNVFRQFRGRDPCPKALIKQLCFNV